MLSPFFSYFETMQSKNSKDFVNNTLVDSLPAMQRYIQSITDESDHEPNGKRQKIDSKEDKLQKLN